MRPRRRGGQLHRDARESPRAIARAVWLGFALFASPGLALAEPAQHSAPPPADGAWNAGVEVKKNQPAPPKAPNTTVIERAGDTKSSGGAAIKLVALLTADGQQIDQGLVWRIFQTTDAHGKSKLISEQRDPSPSVKLQPGDYTINAAFGRANLTRKVTVKPNTAATEQFVLNAGGLRLVAYAGGKPLPPSVVSYSIYADDRDQFSNRTAVMTGAKPNLIIRLNSGIYRIVSVYGDANSKVETDVTVEAGKLTETAVAHAGGQATFKLVTRTGGEAMPDTRWSIQTEDGDVVKESIGALPTHILVPGAYVVSAASGGHLYKRRFAIKDGDVTNIEVMMDAGAASAEGGPIEPSLEIKSP